MANQPPDFLPKIEKTFKDKFYAILVLAPWYASPSSGLPSLPPSLLREFFPSAFLAPSPVFPPPPPPPASAVRLFVSSPPPPPPPSYPNGAVMPTTPWLPQGLPVAIPPSFPPFPPPTLHAKHQAKKLMHDVLGTIPPGQGGREGRREGGEVEGEEKRGRKRSRSRSLNRNSSSSRSRSSTAYPLSRPSHGAGSGPSSTSSSRPSSSSSSSSLMVRYGRGEEEEEEYDPSRPLSESPERRGGGREGGRGGRGGRLER